MMFSHMTMMMGRMTIIVGHMSMMIRSVRKFIKVFIRKKCKEIPKIVVLGQHDHVGGIT